MIKSYVYLYVEKLLFLISGFLCFAMIGRYIGAESLGELSLAVSVVAIVSIASTLGMEKIIISEVARNKSCEKLITNAFFIRVITSVLILVTFTFFGVSYIYILLSVNLLFQSYTIMIYYYSGKEKFVLVSKINSIGYLIFLPIKLIAIMKYENLLSYVLLLTLESLVILLMYGFVFNRKHTVLKINFIDKTLILDILKRSWPLALSSSIIILYTRVDQIMIATLLDKHTLGIYSSAVKVSDAIAIIGQVISSVVFPIISKQTDEKKISDNFVKYNAVIIAVYLFAFLFLFFFGEFFINVAFGSEFNKAYVPMLILSSATLFSILGVMATNLLVTQGLEKYRVSRVILGLVINIILNALLIPWIGILGAAIATLVSQISSAVLGNLLNKKTHFLFKLQIQSFNVTKALK